MNCTDFFCVNYSRLIAFREKWENKTQKKNCHSRVLINNNIKETVALNKTIHKQLSEVLLKKNWQNYATKLRN